MTPENSTRERMVATVAAGLSPETSITHVCREHGVSRSSYYGWRSRILDAVPRLTPGTQVEEKTYDGQPSNYRAINFSYATLAMLNDTGYWLSRQVNGMRSILDLARGLVERYGIDLPRAVRDVDDFAHRLKRHKLLYFAGEEPPELIETTSMYRPQEVWLHVTNACNLRCITCFKGAGRSYRREMPLGMLQRVMREVKDLGAGYIVISGGEPFIRRDILDILALTNEVELKVLLITNGTFIDERIAKRLGEIRPRIVQVSLDGSCPEVNDRIRGAGSFEKTIRAARLLVDEGLDVRLFPTITRLNLHDLPNIQNLVRELRPGFNHLAFAKFFATGRGLAHEEELDIPEEEYFEMVSQLPMRGWGEEAVSSIGSSDANGNGNRTKYLPTRIAYGARKVNCGFGVGTLSIDADAKVYPCHWLHDAEWQAGDLYEETLADVYHNSPVFRRCRNTRVDQDIKACTDCSFKYFCGGGCRARALSRGGAVETCDPACAWMRQYYEQAFWTDFEWTSVRPPLSTDGKNAG